MFYLMFYLWFYFCFIFRWYFFLSFPSFRIIDVFFLLSSVLSVCPYFFCLHSYIFCIIMTVYHWAWQFKMTSIAWYYSPVCHSPGCYLWSVDSYDIVECCRGISLLAIAGKILARVLLNRLLNHLQRDLFPESQCGFCEGRGTIDMIFAAR